MALIDFLKHSQEKIEGLQQKAGSLTTQLENDPVKALSDIFKTNTKQARLNKPNAMAKKIVSLYYSKYPEIPYISNDRSHKWLEMAASMPKTTLVKESMMVRFNNGLLPGHIYMLYWLNKYTDKKVPAYFEYKYGIDFDLEKSFLRDNGYLNDMDKPTGKGLDAINNHAEVIANHSVKPDRSIEGISKQILAARDSLIRNGFTEYEFMANRDCCSVCARLNGKHFPVAQLKIGVNAPPMHEGCRCAISAYEDDAEYEKWLNSL